MLSASFAVPGNEVATRALLSRFTQTDRTGEGGKLPNFLSNALPEGALRGRIAVLAGTHRDDEFAILAACAHDLPGAIHMRAINAPDRQLMQRLVVQNQDAQNSLQPSVVPRPIAGAVSLSGIQPKLQLSKDTKGRYTFVAKRGRQHFIGIHCPQESEGRGTLQLGQRLPPGSFSIAHPVITQVAKKHLLKIKVGIPIRTESSDGHHQKRVDLRGNLLQQTGDAHGVALLVAAETCSVWAPSGECSPADVDAALTLGDGAGALVLGQHAAAAPAVLASRAAHWPGTSAARGAAITDLGLRHSLSPQQLPPD